MKRNTKILTLIFSVIFIVSAFAVSAFAAVGGDEIAFDNLTANAWSNIKFDQDETNKQIVIEHNEKKPIRTWDLADFALKNSTVTVNAGTTLKISNGTLDNTIISVNGGKLILDNVVVTNNASRVVDFYADIDSEVEINNSVINTGVAYVRKNVKATVNLNNTKVYGTLVDGIVESAKPITVNVDSECVFENGSGTEILTGLTKNVTVNVSDHVIFKSFPKSVTAGQVNYGENNTSTVVMLNKDTYRVLPGILGDMYLNLDSDINLIFITTVGEGNNAPQMKFTLAGVETVVDGVKRDDGKWVFRFEEIDPRYMGDDITAELIGEKLSNPQSTVSVKDYCLKVIEKYPDDAKLKALVSDILYYGAAAQTYTKYNVDALVTKGVESKLAPSEFAYTSIVKNFGGDYDANFEIVGAGLRLEGEMNMYFNVICTAADLTNVKLVAEINGRPVEIAGKDFVKVSDNAYRVIFNGVMAYEFDDVITAQLTENGAAKGQKLTYTVDAYINEKLNEKPEAELDALLRAISNYGKSANAYYYGEVVENGKGGN